MQATFLAVGNVEQVSVEPFRSPRLGWGPPGGFIEYGEAWRDGAVRELLEETTTTANADEVTLFDVLSAPSGTLLVIGLLPRPSAACQPRWRRTSRQTSRW